jgi:hypothetical protein
MIGKQDRNGDDYYFTTTNVPSLIDLSNSVIHFYPDEDDNGFGGELVIRHYDQKNQNNTLRRRRTRTKPDLASESDTTESDTNVDVTDDHG